VGHPELKDAVRRIIMAAVVLVGLVSHAGVIAAPEKGGPFTVPVSVPSSAVKNGTGCLSAAGRPPQRGEIGVLIGRHEIDAGCHGGAPAGGRRGA
jgi:hypothetical protein